MSDPPPSPNPGDPPPRPRPLRRTAAAVGIVALGLAAVGLAAALRVPEAFRGPPFAKRAGAEEAARRFVSGLSALHAAFIREGAWEGAFAEDDVNSWLATDLRKNHRDVLPNRVTDLQVDFRPRQIAASARLAVAGLRPVASVVLGVRLREPNQLGVTVEQAAVGAIPLPGGPILAEVRRRFEQLGMVTSTRQLDGRSVLVVYIPSTHESGGPSHWLEALSIGDGSLAVAGRTLVHREGDGR
jgi:hypothetical protein